MIKVAAFVGKLNYPSTRFRVLQYIDILNEMGVDIDVLNTSVGRYPTSIKTLSRIVWGVRNIIENIPNVINSYKYDVTFLQREMLSTFYTLEGLTKSPRVLDVDDAIFTSRNGSAARKLAKNVDHIICGNEYLANWFSQYNKNISVIPTAVDTQRFTPRTSNFLQSEKIILVWSGTSYGYSYFIQSGLLDALVKLLNDNNNVYLRIIADSPPPFQLPKLEFKKWSPECEVSLMNECDIGLMPLADNQFAKGKCSYKMLTYMSCGIPVVVSPVGMNRDVIAMGNVGLSANSAIEWYECLSFLVNNRDEGVKMGLAGHDIIKDKFDLPIVANQIMDVIKLF